MKNQKLNKNILIDAISLSNANQIKYVLYKNTNTNEVDYCSLAEWNLVFEHLPNYQRIKTVVPTEKTDYESVLINANLMLNKHSDLFKGFDIIEFKENQFTYKLIRK